MTVRKPPVEAVVLDLGGVCLGYDFGIWAGQVAPYCPPGYDPMTAFREYSQEHGDAANRGQLDLDHFHHWFVSRAGLGMDLEDFTHAWNHIFWPLEEMTALIPRLRVPHYLLSNTNPAHVRHIRQHYQDLLGLFTQVFMSCEIGLAKPEPAVYQAVARQTGLPAAAHLFVDDMLPNVAGAQAAGWQALHFTGPEALERELEERGLLAGQA